VPGDLNWVVSHVHINLHPIHVQAYKRDAGQISYIFLQATRFVSPFSRPSHILLTMRLHAAGRASGVLLVLASSTSALSQWERTKLNHRPCPDACNSNSDWSTWYEYHNVRDLAVCDEPLLLTFNLYAPIDDPNTHTTIRACTVGDDESTVNFLEESSYVSPDAKGSTNFGPANRRRDDSTNTNTTCGVGSAPEPRVTSYLANWETEKTLRIEAAMDVVVAAQTLKKSLQKAAVTCAERKNLFAYYHGTLVGAYSGSQVDLMQTSESMLDELIAELTKSSSPLSRKTLEACGSYCTATHIFGVVADPSGDFGAVQDIVKRWNEGELLHEASTMSIAASRKLRSSSLWIYGNGNSTGTGNGTALESRQPHRRPARLSPRAECRSIRVEDKDTCTSLASRCGIGSTCAALPARFRTLPLERTQTAHVRLMRSRRIKVARSSPSPTASLRTTSLTSTRRRGAGTAARMVTPRSAFAFV
jgi:hypothetical protein